MFAINPRYKTQSFSFLGINLFTLHKICQGIVVFLLLDVGQSYTTAGFQPILHWWRSNIPSLSQLLLSIKFLLF